MPSGMHRSVERKMPRQKSHAVRYAYKIKKGACLRHAVCGGVTAFLPSDAFLTECGHNTDLHRFFSLHLPRWRGIKGVDIMVND